MAPDLRSSRELLELSVSADERDRVTVAVTGELDLFTRALLAEQLARVQKKERGKRDVVLDLHELEFMDCAALATVLSAQKRGKLEVVAPEGGAALMLLRATNVPL